jgi:hypothetical protein
VSHWGLVPQCYRFYPDLSAIRIGTSSATTFVLLAARRSGDIEI